MLNVCRLNKWICHSELLNLLFFISVFPHFSVSVLHYRKIQRMISTNYKPNMRVRMYVSVSECPTLIILYLYAFCVTWISLYLAWYCGVIIWFGIQQFIQITETFDMAKATGTETTNQENTQNNTQTTWKLFLNRMNCCLCMCQHECFLF